MFDKVSQESKVRFILNSGYSVILMFSCFIETLDNAFLLSSTALADFTGFYVKDCLILGINNIVLEEHTCMGVTRLEAGTG